MTNYRYIFYSLLSLFAVSCGNHSHSESNEAEEEHHHDHGDEIVLHAEDAEKFGVKTIEIQPDTFFEVLTVSGEVLNSSAQSASVVAPKSGTVTFNSNAVLGNKVNKGSVIATVSTNGISGGDASEAAKARITAAKRELDRLTPLLSDGLITKSEYNSAKAEYEQALAAYSPAAASGAAVSPITGSVIAINVKNGEYVASGQPIAEISSDSEIVIKADISSSAKRLLSNISGANIRPVGADMWFGLRELNGKIKGESKYASNSGYESVFISIDNNGLFTPGTFAEIALLGAARQDVISVPVSAISEQQGTRFVFVKVDEDGYEKIPVQIGATDGKKVEIVSGLVPGQEVVSEGTVFVRLAETSGNVPEGHSHNH